MTNNEINKYIHTKIIGKCCHEGSRGFDGWYRLVLCIYCHIEIIPEMTATPDYCSDSSPRALLNEVICIVGTERVYNMLLKPYVEAHERKLKDNTNIFRPLGATAVQIATACVEAHKIYK